MTDRSDQRDMGHLIAFTHLGGGKLLLSRTKKHVDSDKYSDDVDDTWFISRDKLINFDDGWFETLFEGDYLLFVFFVLPLFYLEKVKIELYYSLSLWALSILLCAH